MPRALALVPLQGFELGELLALTDQVVGGDEPVDLGSGNLEDEDLVAGKTGGIGSLESILKKGRAGEEGPGAGRFELVLKLRGGIRGAGWGDYTG